ncbi:MAG: hybrid sensor histidine kinase/response regulator [Methanomassiliicoccales archaeon]|nr:hybrid sensor histidine kinase/response regulator [Methanomassiliicoccales archaeon]
MILALLVDDEPPLCSVAKQFLEQSHEMVVDTVFSAQETLQSLDQKAYDVIVSDYQMPGMDGIQLLKSLRSTGVLIPFILFTGKGREEVVIEALNNGADSYLQKGGNVTAQFAELGNAITQVVKKKRAEEALREANRKLQLMTSITRHDIRNQIMSMRGYLELANDSRDPLKANELRKKALGVTRNIESTIEFTKDYQEMGVREPAWHNVHAVVDTLDPNLTSMGFWLENQLPEVEIFADPMLVKVLQSIADNSARHGVHATLMRFSSEMEGEVLKIICEDDGVGVPVDEKGKIFERGYGKHTGLGLHFAREVFHITGIGIEENGEPGKGARFVISVPNGRWRYAGEEER